MKAVGIEARKRPRALLLLDTVRAANVITKDLAALQRSMTKNFSPFRTCCGCPRPLS